MSIQRIETAAQLQEIVRKEEGFLYNAFPSRDPKNCPIHRIGCRYIQAMLAVEDGPLAIHKIWAADLSALAKWLRRQKKAFSLCRVCGLPEEKVSFGPEELTETPTDPVILGRVAGTPRTYGQRRTEDEWRTRVVSGDWSGLERKKDILKQPLQGPVAGRAGTVL